MTSIREPNVSGARLICIHVPDSLMGVLSKRKNNQKKSSNLSSVYEDSLEKKRNSDTNRSDQKIFFFEYSIEQKMRQMYQYVSMKPEPTHAENV